MGFGFKWPRRSYDKTDIGSVALLTLNRRTVVFHVGIMSFFLALASFLILGIGVLVFIRAESSIHEIEAGILFLIAAGLFGSAAIIDAIKLAGIAILKDIKKQV